MATKYVLLYSYKQTVLDTENCYAMDTAWKRVSKEGQHTFPREIQNDDEAKAAAVAYLQELYKKFGDISANLMRRDYKEYPDNLEFDETRICHCWIIAGKCGLD